MARFPETQDERFLLTLAQIALNTTGHVLGWIDWHQAADFLKIGENRSHNMMLILARTFLLEKKGDQVRLTHVSFNHFGDHICKALKIEWPNFPREKSDYGDDDYDEEESSEREI